MTGRVTVSMIMILVDVKIVQKIWTMIMMEWKILLTIAKLAL